MPQDELVNWTLAARAVNWYADKRPLTDSQLHEVTAVLHQAMSDAQDHVRTVTGLHPQVPMLPFAVLDRSEWISAAIDDARTRENAIDTAHPEPRRRASALAMLACTRESILMGMQLARHIDDVLGTIPLWASETSLLLSAHNMVHYGKTMNAELADFCLWICLHEQTHRVQFAIAPWLCDHIRRLAIDSVVDDDAADHAAAVLTLIEGHAEVVRHLAAREYIPAYDRLCDRHDSYLHARHRTLNARIQLAIDRRLGHGEQVEHRYNDGGNFVHDVVNRVGMEGFNRIWESAETLPTSAEIAAPESWIHRILGHA